MRLGLGGGGRLGLSVWGGLLIHDALPLEDAALLDDQRLRRDVALHPSAPVELGTALHLDASLEPSGHRDVLRLDVRVHLALRREHHIALGADLALHLAVHAEGPRRDDGTLELGSGADDRHLSTLFRHPFRHPSHPLARLTDRNVLVSELDILPLRLLAVFSPPDHVAFTASRGPDRACLIASSSSTERL